MSTAHGFVADTSKTKRYEDGDAWLELRVEFSKRDDAIINDHSGPRRVLSDGGIEFVDREATASPAIFGLLAVKWSLSDGKPTSDQYSRLRAETGRWVDECLNDAIKTGRGEIEGKDQPQTPPATSPDSSPEEANHQPTD